MLPQNAFRHAPIVLMLSFGSLFAMAQTREPMSEQFRELPDPTADTLSDWSNVPKGLHVSFASIDERYPKSVAPVLAIAKQHRLRGWKGERVSAQLLLWTTENIAGAEVGLSDFRSKNGGTLDKSIASAHFVRYVMTDEFAGGCGYRKPEDFAASLSADMLDDLPAFDLEAKKARPVWIKTDIPRDAQKGIYTTTVTIKAKDRKAQKMTLELEVIDRLLPEAKHWTYHLDYWQHPSAVARAHGLEMWSDAHFEAMKPTMQMLANAGQKVITATVNKDPWNVQTYDPYADMIVWTKQKNGNWAYDYAVFDRWVRFMMDLGVRKMINCYSIVPWNNEIHYRDEASDQWVDVAAKPGTPVFEELWTPFLRDFVRHLRSNGWLDITNIAMDERSPEEMDATFALLEKVAPELGASYADNHKTYKRFPDSEDISIACGHPFSPEDLADRRARGLNTSFYICCSDAFPNQFTFSDPAESTYLAWYAESAGFDGMLRWAYNSWVENPMLDSRFRTWPAGDTYIVYPHGRSSIRYERMLEGVQDYEKLQATKRHLALKNDRESLRKLQNAVAKLQAERTPTWNSDLNAAKQLLNELSN